MATVEVRRGCANRASNVATSRTMNAKFAAIVGGTSSAPHEDMRHRAILLILSTSLAAAIASAACSSADPAGDAATCTTAACTDGGAPDGGTPDVGQYDAEDFASFSLSWYGTGVSESFMMNRDCGVSQTQASSGAGTKSGSGIVPETDCKKFETLVTSPAVIGALADKSPKCSDATDDYSTYTLTLVDGGVLSRNASGCSGVEPFSTVRSEIHRLDGYAPAHADAGDAGDASETGDSGGDADADGGG
jgi:hypothetical protein